MQWIIFVWQKRYKFHGTYASSWVQGSLYLYYIQYFMTLEEYKLITQISSWKRIFLNVK